METDEALSARIDALEETMKAVQDRMRNMEYAAAIITFIREKKTLARERKNDFVVIKPEDIAKAYEGCRMEIITWAMELAIQPGDEKNPKTGAVRYYLKPKR